MVLDVYFTGSYAFALGYSIQRNSDGLQYDFSNGTFVSSPVTPIQTVSPDSGIYSNRYTINVTIASGQVTDGAFFIGLHNFSSHLLVDQAALAPVDVNLSQTLPSSLTIGTVANALAGSESQAGGKLTLIGNTLTVYRGDNVTPYRVFTVDSPTSPTQRV